MWSTTTLSPFSDTNVTTSLSSNDTIDTEVVNSAMSQCPDMQMFGNAYKEIHGYASLTVCTFGMIANILNVIVLTRKEMITPTNYILTALAIADLLNMVEYVPFAVYMKFLPDSEDGSLKRSYAWAVFVLFHSNFSQICHTTAIWLTLTLAIWRYIMVTRPVQCKTLCSMHRAKLSIALAYIISPLLCLPLFYSFSIITVKSTTSVAIITEVQTPVNDSLETNLVSSSLFTSVTELPRNLTSTDTLKYVVNLSNLAKSFPLLKQFNFWFFSIVIKLIPCAILTVVSFRLVHSLLEAKKRKDRLFRENLQMTPISLPNDGPVPNEELGSRSASFTRSTGDMCATTRTTRMLLAILVLFLITEFPQGILALLSDLMGEDFFKYCYMSLSDLMDFMALLNSGINFILYCTMSSKFREVFCLTFEGRFCLKSKIFP